MFTIGAPRHLLISSLKGSRITAGLDKAEKTFWTGYADL